MFADSYHLNGQVPDSVDNDHARAYLMARLNRARLRTKLKGLGVDEQIENHKLALKEYEYMLDYGERNPQCYHPPIALEKEMNFCREMVNMLPTKLSRMAAKRR